jgi:hypothetical protein
MGRIADLVVRAAAAKLVGALISIVLGLAVWLESWRYILSAPWPVKVLLIALATGLLVLGGYLMRSYLLSPVKGQLGPRWLKIYGWRCWRISWDLGNRGLGLTSRGDVVTVSDFTLQYRVNRGRPLLVTKAEIFSLTNGERLAMLVDAGPRPARPDEIEYLPNNRWTYCRVLLDLEPKEFLNRFTPGDLVIEFDDGTAFRCRLRRDELGEVIERFNNMIGGVPNPVGRLKSSAG